MHLTAALKLLGIVLDTVLLAPVIVAVGAFDPRRAYDLCRLWARVILVLSGVRVRVERRAALDPRRPYVFMSNHRSHFDVLAVVAALPGMQLRWVAKKELTRVPVFGWALRHLDHVIIDRADHEQAMASLRQAAARMQAGISVIIFPEGTRAPRADALLPLKRGGFALAREAGVPIVPIAVCGSLAILPRGTWQVRSGTIRVEVGEPMPTRDVDLDALVERVREWLERHAREGTAPEQARRAVGVG